MRSFLLSLITILLLCISLPAYSQVTKSYVTERDSLLDSLRKTGTPESDLSGYSNYLLKKRHHSKDHVHSVMKVDSLATCYNPDFEYGDMTNWTGYTGNCCPITATSAGIILGRHTVMSGTGTDPYSQNDIPVVAPGGGNYTVRLGNDNVGSEAEKLVHKFLVTTQTTSFTYQYAVVLQDPNHEQSAQPRFEVKVFDSTGTLVPCGYYQVTAAGTIPGFVSVGDIRYKKWTTVGVDLSAYIGQFITIEFTTGDCSYGGHFGYAYIDATCEPLKIRKKFCPGDSTATLTAPDGFENYNWSTGHTTQSIIVQHPQDGDTIWAYLTSVTGCPTSLYAILIQEEPPTVVTAGGDTLICPGNNVQLNASGATDYSWNISGNSTVISTDQYPIVHPMLSTTYIATISNACGFLTDSVEVQVKPYTPLIASNDTTICTGDVQLSVTGNTNTQWSPSTGLSCTNCINPVATTTVTTMYHVTAVDTLSGCPLSDSVSIQVDSSFLFIYAGADQNICFGETVYLGSIGQGATNYTWTHTEPISCDTCIDVLASPSVTTVYVLSGANRCTTQVDSVTITVFALPVADAGVSASVCYGDVITLNASGGTSGTDYQWSPSTALSCSNCPNPTLTVTSNEIYYLSVSNAGGCYSNDTVGVRIRSLFHTTTSNQSICEGVSITLTAAEDTTKPLIWAPSASLSCDTCAVTIATPTTTTLYTVLGMDSTSCRGIDSVYVQVILLPVSNPGPDRDICIGQYVYLPGSGGTTYQWYPLQNISCAACSNPQVNPDTTTTYNLVAINMCGSDTDSVTVTVHPLPIITASNDMQICTGLGASLSATGASTYQWSPSTSLSCIYCASPNVLNVGSTVTYTVTGRDQFGCTSTDDVTVTALILPTINAGNDSAICIGASATLHPNGQLNQAIWSPATALSCTGCASPVSTPTTGITYTIDVTDPVNGCHNIDNVTITVKYPPVAVVSSAQTICNGSTTGLNVGGGTSWSWVPSTGLSCTTCTGPIASPSQTITYTVTATNECGSDADQITVTVLYNPQVSLGVDMTGCVGDNMQLNAGTPGPTGTIYTWSPSNPLSCNNCTTPIYTNASSDITFNLTVTNTNGCISSDDIAVIINSTPTISLSAEYKLACEGLNVSFVNSGSAAQNYSWTFGDGATAAIKDPVHNYTNPSATYEVHLTASNGVCGAEATITTLPFDMNNLFHIPNVFTPNDDTRNDCFFIDVNKPEAKPLLSCGTIEVFDRWGKKVFTGKLTDCWNGKIDNNGKALSDGTYYYIIETDREKTKGFITLAR